MSSWRWPARSQENSTPQLPTAFRTFCCSASSRAWDCRSLGCPIATSHPPSVNSVPETLASPGSPLAPRGSKNPEQYLTKEQQEACIDSACRVDPRNYASTAIELDAVMGPTPNEGGRGLSHDR